MYRYITGIIQHYDHKVLAINGMPDHLHVFFGMRPTQSLSELMKQVKQDSSQWINSHKLTEDRFSWQQGFGAFSYGKSQVRRVIRYIERQEEHHKKKTFSEEYVALLEAFHVPYDARFVFAPVDTDVAPLTGLPGLRP